MVRGKNEESRQAMCFHPSTERKRRPRKWEGKQCIPGDTKQLGQMQSSASMSKDLLFSLCLPILLFFLLHLLIFRFPLCFLLPSPLPSPLLSPFFFSLLLQIRSVTWARLKLRGSANLRGFPLCLPAPPSRRARCLSAAAHPTVAQLCGSEGG